MTVSVAPPIISYVGDGAATSFAFPFRILEETDMEVQFDGIVQAGGFNIPVVGLDSGGDVIFAIAPPTAVVIVLRRRVLVNRTNDYIEGDGLSSGTLDNDFDRVVMMIQENATFGATITETGGLDMQGNNIINVAEPVNASDAATMGYVDSTVINGGAVKVAELHIATAGQTVFTLATPYLVGFNIIKVYINGVFQNIGAFLETSTTSITFTSPLTLGDEVQFTSDASLSVLTTTAADVSVAGGTNVQSHIDNNGNPHGTTSTQVGLGNVENILNNLNAIIDPNTANDNTQGYQLGSRWINTTNDSSFTLVDATTGAAVWSVGGGNSEIQVETIVATGGQTVFNLANSYEVGTNTIEIHINGVHQAPAAYAETSSNVITFTSPLTLADDVVFRVIAISIGGGGGGGISDHTLLTNIGVNTHAQIDTFITGHTHLESDITDLQNYQPLDSDLTTIAGLAHIPGNVITSSGGVWTSGPGGGGASDNWLNANNGVNFVSAPVGSGTNSIASGNGATASMESAIAIGDNASATAIRAGAIGSDVVNNVGDSFRAGNSFTNILHLRNSGRLHLSGTQAAYVFPGYTTALLPVAVSGASVYDTDTQTIKSFNGSVWLDNNHVHDYVPLDINLLSGTSYTLSLTDGGNAISLSNVGAITLTIPTNASAAFAIGTEIVVYQEGAGQVSIVGPGVVIDSADSLLSTRTQYSGITMIKKSINTWIVIGDLA